MTEQHLETLRDLNHNYVRSVDQADVGWFDRHLAPGFMNTNPDGTVLDRAASAKASARECAHALAG